MSTPGCSCWIFAISMPGFRSLCAALCPMPRPWWCPVPGPRSAGACLHKNNEVRQPALWLKTIPAYFTRPPPDLTVRSQDTTRGSHGSVRCYGKYPVLRDNRRQSHCRIFSKPCAGALCQGRQMLTSRTGHKAPAQGGDRSIAQVSSVYHYSAASIYRNREPQEMRNRLSPGQ